MPWIQLSVEVSGGKIDTVVAALEEMGSQATTQQNAGEDSYFDLAHPAEPGWDRQTVSGLFEDQDNSEILLAELMGKVDFVKDVELMLLPDQDWETAWLDQYEAIEITPDLWVYPGWVTPAEHIKTTVKIDPGMAFGTGTHETTRLCMQALAGLNLNHCSVLDYGCGSGILAITALKLGASRAVGVDIDPKAEIVSRENALNNGVASCFAIQSVADVDAQTFDIVIANILAFALVDLASALIAHAKKDGKIVLSGILAHQVDEIVAAYDRHFVFERLEESGWVALLGRRDPDKNHK
ncbi:MAG: 50S ribosomal protein L11 methyltransferase [Proteobacteria bacterium]|nr:50S ribosomal protein L11 methyltransferase [Pseudomonadota bacterium]